MNVMKKCVQLSEMACLLHGIIAPGQMLELNYSVAHCRLLIAFGWRKHFSSNKRQEVLIRLPMLDR